MQRAQEFSTQLPFMAEREKGEIDSLIGNNVTLIEYGFLEGQDDDGNPDKYVCFIVKEDDKNFYFGSSVLTKQMQELDVEGYGDEIRIEGLPMCLSKKKSKNKRTYTYVTYYPES